MNGAPDPSDILTPEQRQQLYAQALAPPPLPGITSGAPGLPWGVSASNPISDWVMSQRAQAAQQGLWNPATGMPTPAGMASAGQQYAGGLLMGTTAPAIRAFHGSPYSFERFDPAKIGTGEGAQAYGHGLYFAESEPVAQAYRTRLAPLGTAAQGDIGAQGMAARAMQGETDPAAGVANLDYVLGVHKATNNGKIDPDFQNKIDAAKAIVQSPSARGSMYEVNLQADPEHFLDWDKPLSQQSQHVQDAVKKAGLVDPKPTIGWEGDSSLWELHQNGRPTGTMLEDSGDGRTYNEIVNGKLTGSIPKQSVDAWKEMHAQSLRDAYRDPDPTGRDLIKNNPGIERDLGALGLPGIRYLDQGSRAQGQGTSNYVVFNPNIIDIIRRYGIAGLIGGGAAAAGAAGKGNGS